MPQIQQVFALISYSFCRLCVTQLLEFFYVKKTNKHGGLMTKQREILGIFFKFDLYRAVDAYYVDIAKLRLNSNFQISLTNANRSF